MNKTVKERFVRLLEGGEYKFGKKVLYNPADDTHCPLGVLVEQAIDEGVYEPVVVPSTYGDKRLGDGRHYPANEVLEWAGMSMNEARAIGRINDEVSPVAAIKYIKEHL